MWDFDSGSADDKVGAVEIDPAALKFHSPMAFALEKDGKKLQTKLYLCLLVGAPSRKTVFFVRHGESTWNAAQESGNLPRSSPAIVPLVASRTCP